jgi:NTP pyrophosphatase (non-canonical NTP hydrolase)
MLNLKENPTLKDIQDYVRQLELERGFSEESTIQKCLLLGEEIGELFKAIRKSEKMKIDANSSVGNIGEELGDILVYLSAIANRYEINLEKAFRDKEEKNKQRKWA